MREGIPPGTLYSAIESVIALASDVMYTVARSAYTVVYALAMDLWGNPVALPVLLVRLDSS